VATDFPVENLRNSNKHLESLIVALSKIIRHQGWRNSVVFSKRSGFVIKGHVRLFAARMLGEKSAPVSHQGYASKAAGWADVIADNKIAEPSSVR